MLGLAIIPMLVLFDVVIASRLKVAAPLAIDALSMATPLENSTVAVVRSDNLSLSHPVAPGEPLAYEEIKEMVWSAIEMAPTKLGPLPSIIPEQSWVVVKPNMVFIKPQYDYSLGDITDPRVTRAVLEYLAEHSQARRITLAMGGSWKGLDGPSHPKDGGAVTQNGVEVDGFTCTWGDDYPGFEGSFQDVLDDLSDRYSDKIFDTLNFNYDLYPNLDAPKEVPVPVANGIGGWAADSYYVSNMVLNCDVMISVPAMKVHNVPGVSLGHKNYMGTASRVMYSGSGWWLAKLHSFPGGPDAVFSDLFSYHPADYVVMGGAWGMEGNGPHHTQGGIPIRTNMVIAGEDPVASDAVAATVMGFNPWDIEHLRRSVTKGYGTLDMNYITVNGDPVKKVALNYKKPARAGTGLKFYYGRGNRVWLIHGAHAGAGLEQDLLEGEADVQPFAGELTGDEVWTRLISPQDQIDLKNYFYQKDGTYQSDVVTYAFTYVHSPIDQSGNLWVGADDGVKIWLNGELVLDNPVSGSFKLVEDQVPVDIRRGNNRLLVKVRNETGGYAFSLGVMDESGSTLPGISYLTEVPVTAISSETEAEALPQGLLLEQNYPNPFNGETAIHFSVPQLTDVELAIFDLAGQQVALLLQGGCPAGEHAVRWDGRDDSGYRLASGLYLYRLKAGMQLETRKLMLIR